MTCYHPLRRFNVGVNEETGKSIGKVAPYNTKWLSKDSQGRFYYHVTDYDPDIRSAYDSRVFTESTPIPCGKCVGCRLDQAREWSVRLMLEAPYHKEAWFLTLTYDDANIPSVVNDDGDIVHPLVKRDIQLFMKRLRKVFPSESVSYYCAGEYGFQNLRPHYHMILFLDEPLESVSQNIVQTVRDGHIYYTNTLIKELWYREGRKGISAGFHLLTDVSMDTCQYVANYATKKVSGELAEKMQSLGLVPPFSLSSRNPAIGRRYFDEHEDAIYSEYSLLLDAGGEPLRVRPPHYFDTIYDGDLTEYKEVRRNASEQRILKMLEETDRDYLKVLADEEKAFKDQASLSMRSKNSQRLKV